MRLICASIMVTAILTVAVSAFADEQPMVVKSRTRLFKQPDAMGRYFCDLVEGEQVSIISKSADGWYTVGTAHTTKSGERIVGYIGPGLLVAPKLAAASQKAASPLPAEGEKKLPAAPGAGTAASPPPEITLVINAPTIESQLQTTAGKKDAESATRDKELEAQKKALADAAVASADKDKAIEVLRAQAAETATKLATLQSSVENEAFRLFIEKSSPVKLRGFGSVRLVPLLDDYLVIIPPDLAKGVEPFFAKIRKVVVAGKAATYLVCDRKYFVPAGAAKIEDDRGNK